jgi:hypothetical protein
VSLFLDSTLDQVSKAITGDIADLYPAGLNFDDPSMDAWQTQPFFLGPGMAQVQRAQKPNSTAFIPGDEIADARSHARGVDPHANSDWLALAKTQLGTPYVWAASDPNQGFDCSGFVQWLVKRVTGTELAHHAATQAQETKAVSKNQLQPGDLLFFNYGDGIAHVEVYMGNGKMIGTANTTEDLDIDPVDWAHFVQGGRVPGMSSGDVSTNGFPAVKKKGKRQPAPAAVANPIYTPLATGPTFLGGALMPLLQPQALQTPTGMAGTAATPSAIKPGETAVQIGKQLAAERGWTGAQWKALYALWNRESGWQSDAVNQSSGATGIPQLLPSAHDIPANWSNPVVQIRWGLNYIAQRYGDPISAMQHSDQQGWY